MSRWHLRERMRRARAGEPLGTLSLDPDSIPDAEEDLPPDPADIDAVVLKHALRRGTQAHCLDLRPVELLRYGSVRGAWLLDAAQVRRLARHLGDRPCVVLDQVAVDPADLMAPGVPGAAGLGRQV